MPIGAFIIGISVLVFFGHAYYLMAFLTLLLLSVSCVVLRFVCLGVCWAFLLVYGLTPLGEEVFNQNITLQGVVSSLVSTQESRLRFQFTVDKKESLFAGHILWVNWYHAKVKLKAGESWRLRLKVKKPHNLANPGVFDFKRWLFSHRIRALATVTRHDGQKIQEKPSWYYLLVSFRQNLALKLMDGPYPHDTRALIIALTLGDKSYLSKQWKTLLRQTGTSHLLAISGLHVGLVAGFVFYLMTRLWRCSATLCLWVPALRASAYCALCAGVSYAAIAGFSLPTQRALIMLSCFLLRYILNKRLSGWQAWQLSLLVVVVLNPLSLMMPGFYLSFAAVASLLLISALAPQRGFKGFFTMQCFCVMALSPMTIYFFKQASGVAVLANYFAIPFVGFFIVPLSLLSLMFVSTPVSHGLMGLLSVGIEGLKWGLSQLSQLTVLQFHWTIHQVIDVILLLMAMLILFVLPYWRLRFVGVVLLIGTVLPTGRRITYGQVRLEVLDVGQGLACLIHTKRHVLLYDTGAKFHSGNDMGRLVILPVMKSLSIDSLDGLVISHSDIDHRGGYDSVNKALSIKQLYVSNSDSTKKSLNCHEVQPWQWDGVLFEFLSASMGVKDDNNRSCVLKVSNQYQSILLPGDIEKPAELALIRHHREKLNATMLIAPHHGSKTSSSEPFISAVHPRFVVFSSGFHNRYGFPHPSVVQRYEAHFVKPFNTAHCGMTRWHMNNHPLVVSPVCFRAQA